MQLTQASEQLSDLQTLQICNQFNSIDGDIALKQESFGSIWPQHNMQLAVTAQCFPQMSRKLIQKVYDVLNDPWLVHRLLKVAFPDLYCRNYKAKELEEIFTRDVPQKKQSTGMKELNTAYFTQQVVKRFTKYDWVQKKNGDSVEES